jgi:hypothetical protein
MKILRKFERKKEAFFPRKILDGKEQTVSDACSAKLKRLAHLGKFRA